MIIDISLVQIFALLLHPTFSKKIIFTPLKIALAILNLLKKYTPVLIIFFFFFLMRNLNVESLQVSCLVQPSYRGDD